MSIVKRLAVPLFISLTTLILLSGTSGAIIDIGVVNPHTVQGQVGDVQVYAPGCNFQDVSNVLPESNLPDDPDYFFPFGLVEFTINNCDGPEAEVILTFTIWENTARSDPPANLNGYVYKKYGPTPDNPTPHWYDFMYDGQTGAEISGGVVTLHLVDGLRGDDDLTENGTIVDQGGPGISATLVPAMNQWGMVMFLLLSGAVSLYYLRRKRRSV